MPLTGSQGNTSSYWLSPIPRDYARMAGPYSMPWTRLVLKHDAGEICVQNFYAFMACRPLPYPVETMIWMQDPDFRFRELTYAGSQSGVLTFDYVERTGFTARGRATATYTFSAEPGSVLEMEGIRLQLHSVDEGGLAYTVLQGFPDSP